MDNPTLFFRRRRAKDSSATSVAVIGLGRFGGALATELVRSGTEVLGIDTDEDVVQSLNGVLTHVVRADSTKEVALNSSASHSSTGSSSASDRISKRAS